VVELVLHRASAQTAEPLDAFCSGRVAVGDLNLGVALEQAAEVGDAEAALVALVGLGADGTENRVDEHPESEAGLVRIAGVVHNLDGKDTERDVDLWGGEPGAAR